MRGEGGRGGVKGGLVGGGWGIQRFVMGGGLDVVSLLLCLLRRDFCSARRLGLAYEDQLLSSSPRLGFFSFAFSASSTI